MTENLQLRSSISKIFWNRKVGYAWTGTSIYHQTDKDFVQKILLGNIATHNSASYQSQKEVLFDWLVVLVSLHSLSDVLPIAMVRVDHNELLGNHVAQVRAVTRSLYLHDSPYWLSSKLYQPFCQILSLALMLMIFLVLADYKNPFMTDFWKGENALHKNNIIKT